MQNIEYEARTEHKGHKAGYMEVDMKKDNKKLNKWVEQVNGIEKQLGKPNKQTKQDSIFFSLSTYLF